MRALLVGMMMSSCSFVIELPELPLCGDGVLDSDEQCDDGNAIAGDGCNPPCTLPTETVFNTTTQESQSNVKLAFFSNGASLLVFEDDSFTPPDVDGEGAIRARHFNSDGAPTGDDFVVNQFTTMEQEHADVAAQQIAIVVWDDSSGAEDGVGIRARAFIPSGGALGPDFSLNEMSAGNQSDPAIASTNAGFLAAWWDEPNEQIRGRRIDNAGAPAGVELQISGAGAAGRAALRGSSARFLVVWAEMSGSTEALDIVARFVERDETMGPTFIVNTTTLGDQTQPAVAFDATLERFMVVWVDASGTADTDGTGIRARIFDAGGAPLGDDFAVNELIEGSQESPAAAANEGVFLVAWNGLDSDELGVRARRVQNDGTLLGSEGLVNTITKGQQNDPAVVAAPNVFHVLWEDESGAPPDLQNDSIRGLVLPIR